MIVALALFLRAQVNYHYERQHYLNERDQRIESIYRRAALEGRPPEETGGLRIAASNRHLILQEAEAVETSPK
jgi:hypothetical protein